ncbi:pyrimidine 5'-nucleotidase [Nitrospirillum iridis]|uniref:Putative hydrolase of the HAD superfamily n=1 Tax=Nitrospirillum iridis TaxID=765888 RepID=A0A7X0AYF5_9PROT|nr:pyrimidine 5'-nucleotidase [Nitrospirillum iridis]MBB6252424.1 putative hydrolase of the HAD superfamily [Nitrospirillum iridis]
MMTKDAPPPAAGPFRHVDTWIFDLDNTLYPAACNLFAQVDVRIGAYIAQALGLDADAAKRLQKDYFRQYGTSLRGLMLNHGMPPEPFLEYVHDIDVSAILPQPGMADSLAALPGRKIIYTNGSRGHAENVMRRLGVADHFHAVFDIVAADYTPKPEAAPYTTLIQRHGIDPTRAVMVEDIARNLEPAAALGMATVFVDTGSPFSLPNPQAPGPLPAYVQHRITDVPAWLAQVAADLSLPRPRD